MVPDPSEPVHVPIERLTLATLFDEVAERLASRLFVLFEKRTDVRALTLARLDLSTLRNMLDVAGDAPALVKCRELAVRVAEQLQAVTR
jgi:hypothetical protein